MRTLFISAILLTTTAGAAAGAVLRAAVPAPDAVVATQLLPRALKASLQRLTQDPARADSAQRLAAARRMIEAGRASADPRTLGYAESLLALWPADAADAPVDALVLHATIAQSRHAFARAQSLLDRVVARSTPGAPAFAQALLTRATIAQVTGDFGRARSDCGQLDAVAPEIAALCAASIDVVAGRIDVAIEVLRRAGLRAAPNVRAWALAMLAQAHEQRGERAAAAQAYRAALAAGDDLVTRLAYADFVLAGGAPDDAAALLAGVPPTDGVLLREWRSARMQRRGDAALLEERLQTRLDDARRRGDGSDLLHARDWAWFELERGNTAEALRLAQANWRDQREPADLLILAHAAAASGDAHARRQVRAWLTQTRLQDVRVAAALQEPRR
jgi:tetratricopeptide (TPR) repeat protein